MPKSSNGSAKKRTARLNDNTDLLIYAGVFLLWYAYFFMTLQSPVDTPYDLSDNVIVALRLTIAAPLLLIWFVGVYAFVQLSLYKTVIKAWEQRAFRYVSYGVILLLTAMVVPVLLSTASSYFAVSESVDTAISIVINYTRVYTYLFAFICFLAGSYILKKGQKIEINVARTVVLLLPLLIPAFFWLEVIFQTPEHVETIYHMRVSMVILTVVLPSLATWVIGSLAIVSIYRYARQVKGVIYARALKGMVIGIALIVLGAIFLQTVTSLGSQRLVELRLRELLGLIYLFLLIITAGHIFIARGAKKLTKIEVV